MFGKLNRHHFNSIYNNTKKHLGNIYHHTKNVLGHIDNGISVGRTIFSVLQPYIEHYGQGHINKHAMKALTHYDDIKKRVVDAHDTAENHLNDISGKLKGKRYYDLRKL
jgi:hypothetical protein